MQKARVPVVPGGIEAIADADAALRAARTYGLPLALKASGGGGGKGLKVRARSTTSSSAFETARREAEAYFKNGTIYAERYLENPKHIELQISPTSTAPCCTSASAIARFSAATRSSGKKRRQGFPARCAARCARPPCARRKRSVTTRSARSNVSSPATQFFFLEMNTRIQVEHTVTEMISGIDLIREQIRVAAGEPLGFVQDDVSLRGLRDRRARQRRGSVANFRPGAGNDRTYREPGGSACASIRPRFPA